MEKLQEFLATARELRQALFTSNNERSMKQRLMLSSMAAFSTTGITMVLRLGSTIVLAAMLEPAVFGVFAALMSFHFIMTTFTDVGFRPMALTRKEALTDEYLQSQWGARILRGVILYVIAALLSLLLAWMQETGRLGEESAYAASVLPEAIVWTALVFLIGPLSTPAGLRNDRQLDYIYISKFQVMMAAIRIIVTVGCVYIERSVWGLVVSYVLMACISVLTTRWWYPGLAFRPTFYKKDLLEFVSKGKWITGQTMLSSLAQIADRVLLGGYLPSDQFGLYYLARQIAIAPLNMILMIERKFGIQVFVHINKETAENFRAKYYRLRQVIDIVSMTLAGFIAGAIPLVIALVYDDRYSGVSDMVQLLVLGVMLNGQLMLRQALMADQEFRRVMLIVSLRVVTIWGGAFLALEVFDSLELALLVVAFYRLPEALVYVSIAAKREWINWKKEVIYLPLLPIAYGVGWAFNWAFSQLLLT